MISRRGFEYVCNAETAEKIMKDLTVTPNEGSDYGPGCSFCLGRYSGNRVIMPQFYASTQGFAVNEKKFNDVPLSSKTAFAGDLTELQRDVVHRGVHTLKDKGGGIMSLHTGAGKTVCALAIACRLGRRTLILVHKSVLLEQWVQRINQFVPEASVGIIRQNRVDVDADFVVGMLHSISMRTYAAEIFDKFGLLTVDESHHISCPTFSTALSKVNCPYILGLSATPYRKDGLTRVLHWLMGETFFVTQRSLCSFVTVKKTYFDHPKYEDDMPMNKLGSVCMTSVVSILCLLKSRTAKIVSCIQDLVCQNYNVLVLSDRVPHCKTIQQAIGDAKAGLYVGSMKHAARLESVKKQVIVSTYALSREGLDIPKLNALVMATPKSDINQICGRVLRGDNDKEPVIIDFIDAWGVCFAQHRTRMRFYTECGFTVQ